jgi:DNA-binding response OmpR family regulator
MKPYGSMTSAADGLARAYRRGVPRTRILVVEDDPTIADVVCRYLARDGHEVDHVADGPTALNRVLSGGPDLVVLDVMLPGMDGLEVCRRMRRSVTTPVVLLTALGSESDRVTGLEIGADDYLTKPFSPRELVLRVQAVLRRARGASGARQVGVQRDGDLTVDLGARRASRDGRELVLTTREFDLLAFFLSNPGQVFSRKELLADVWGWTVGDESTVTVHVRRLRGKLEDDPAEPLRVVTVWGSGYRYQPQELG